MVLTQDRSRITLENKFLKELGIENPTDAHREKLRVIDEAELTKPIIARMIKEGKTYGQIINYLDQHNNKVAIISRIHRLKRKVLSK